MNQLVTHRTATSYHSTPASWYKSLAGLKDPQIIIKTDNDDSFALGKEDMKRKGSNINKNSHLSKITRKIASNSIPQDLHCRDIQLPFILPFSLLINISEFNYMLLAR
jgi:hypothetical protein